MTSPDAPTSESVPTFAADLEPSPDGAAFAAFRQNSASFGEVGLREGAEASAFYFRTRLYQTPAAMFFRAAGAGHTLRRGPEHVAREPGQINIHVQIEGRSETRSGGRTILIGSGDVALYDHGQTQESIQDDFVMMTLMIPRERAPKLFLAPAAHGTVLPAASAAARLIRRTLETLIEVAGGLTLAEAEAAVEGLVAMMVGAVQARIASAKPSGEGTMEKALAFIDENIADPGLTPARVEAHLALSRTRLYRLFESQGGVGAVVLRRRLDRALKTLVFGVSSKPRLRAVAAENGFRSEEHFARAFRVRFGVTPRAFNDMVGRKDHEALTAQAERAGFVTLQAWLDHVAGRADAG